MVEKSIACQGQHAHSFWLDHGLTELHIIWSWQNMALDLHLLQSGRESLAAEVLQFEQTGLSELD